VDRAGPAFAPGDVTGLLGLIGRIVVWRVGWQGTSVDWGQLVQVDWPVSDNGRYTPNCTSQAESIQKNPRSPNPIGTLYLRDRIDELGWSLRCVSNDFQLSRSIHRRK
jgi:hypothetical protein